MNPFATPDRIFVSQGPQDMRAGIQRLAAKVAADFGGDPVDGALYCFVSRDLEKMKMLRFDVNGWCMYYCRLAEGCFKWELLASIYFLPFRPTYFHQSRRHCFADRANADAPLPASPCPPSRRRRRATRLSGGRIARLSL